MFEEQIIFDPVELGYTSCRIPGILVTKDNVVLATVEARPGTGGDWSGNDILLRRSADGGRTWGPIVKIVDHSDYGEGPINNFCMVDDADGVVHALFCQDYARVYQIDSRDGGLTFSAPREITEVFQRVEYPWRVVAVGPAHGTRMRNGRLVFPVWMADSTANPIQARPRMHMPSVTTAVYSDDNGRSWRMGTIAGPDTPETVNPNETVAVELTDGSLLFNMRNMTVPKRRRLITVSPNGATNWSKPVYDEALLEPICMASLVRQSWPTETEPGRIVFANPDVLEQVLRKHPFMMDRKRVTAQLSEDDCKTWCAKRVIHEGPSSYSDLGVDADGVLLCLYECDLYCAPNGVPGNMTTRNVTLARFDIDWIKGL